MTSTLTPTPSASATDPFASMISTPGVYTVTITPADARRLLERNTQNRRPKTRAIEVYARDMRNGRWKLTNQGIAFDQGGALIDGQNRLMACLLSDAPFTTLLVTGLDTDTRDVIDTGVKRLFADVLRMHGYVNVMQLSGGAGLRFRYEKLVAEKRPYHHFNLPAMRATHEELLLLMQDHPAIEERAGQVFALLKAFPSLPPSSAVAFESLAVEVDADALDEFRTSLITGANLPENDPRLVLRNFLTRTESTRKGGPTAMYWLGILVKAWNDWRHGITRELMTMRADEAMPAIDAKPSWAARKRAEKRSAAAAH